MKSSSIFRYGFLMEQLVKRNFNTKYRQSVLGVLWSFLNPLLTMAVQYVVFSTIFQSEIDHFPVYLLSGIILFNFFTECVSLGMDSIVLNGPLITKVAMPKLVYPLSRSLSSLINLVISFVPLLLVMLLSGAPLTPALLLIPVAAVLLFGFALGMTLILCTLNVFFRDTRFLWSVVSLLWTYATPIFYPIDIIPAAWQAIFRLNPMYQFIDFLRTITIHGACPSAMQFAACILCAVLPLAAGLLVFRWQEDKFVFHL
ncbi:MAG: ABC transporter permease [Clostridia bacterium]|nr:ABC transporter permease [Clostridia bacterium]